MRRRFSQNYIQITKTACVNPKHIIYLSVRVIASDESRTRHGGIALLHRNHEVGEVSGRRVSEAGRKRLFPGSENLLMQITEKRQLPPLILEFTFWKSDVLSVKSVVQGRKTYVTLYNSVNFIFLIRSVIIYVI